MLPPVVVTITSTNAVCAVASCTFAVHVPAAVAVAVNTTDGPVPDAGEKVAMPLQVSLSVSLPAYPGSAARKYCNAPAAVNDSCSDCVDGPAALPAFVFESGVSRMGEPLPGDWGAAPPPPPPHPAKSNAATAPANRRRNMSPPPSPQLVALLGGYQPAVPTASPHWPAETQGRRAPYMGSSSDRRPKWQLSS